MKGCPLISVIIPVYNAAPYLRRCVDSLCAQTFTDFEIILVDDGSTDGSGAICDEYGKGRIDEDKNENENNNENDNLSGNVGVRVRVIHQKNAGVSTARNAGIDAAKGEYLSFVDADDWVEPIFLSAFAAEIKKRTKTKDEDENDNDNDDGVDCVVQGYVNHEGCRIQEPYTFFPTAEALCRELYRLEEKRLIGYVWNKVFRRAMIEEHHVRFNPAIPIGEDFLFCMEGVGLCRSMTVLPHIGYNYFYPPGDHKDYPFAAWNRRLDGFAALLPTMQAMPTAVADRFRANDFKMSIYVLRIAYHEHLQRTERLAYLQKIKSWGRSNDAVHLRTYESSFQILALIVLYLPVCLADALLMFVRRFR